MYWLHGGLVASDKMDQLCTKINTIIAVSANALPRDIEMCLAAGFFDYLTKPIMLDEFVENIGRCLTFGPSCELRQ